MRPIDADALKLELEKGIIIPDDLYGLGIMEGNDHAIKKVSEAPTLDVQPVRRGEWVHGKRNGAYGIWCSRCGTGWEESPNYEVIAACHNFCPHCGADMRQEEHRP